jgi:hypothetical protein
MGEAPAATPAAGAPASPIPDCARCVSWGCAPCASTDASLAKCVLRSLLLPRTPVISHVCRQPLRPCGSEGRSPVAVPRRQRLPLDELETTPATQGD